ncbi:MAG: ABC transporter permease [Paraprevotella sp.]|nr:ABC transporter permease [Paraprevotella sp.]
MITMKELHKIFREAVGDTFFIWRKEAGRVVRDQGVLIFFILVPILYPLLYAFIYTGETVREVPAVVVDDEETALSREFIRRVDATPDVKVVARTGNMEEAKELMRQAKVYGIIRMPEDFSLNVNRGQQVQVGLYCDMSGLLYYKALLTACTDVSLDMNMDLQIKRLGNTTDRQDEVSLSPLDYEDVALFNPTNGFACFLIPAVLILVLQQTLLLGIGLMNGSSRERATFHTQLVHGTGRGTVRLVLGKALCYLMLYALVSVWVLIIVPHLFGLVQIPRAADLLAFMLPYLLSCIFFAMTLSLLVYQRETCMLIFVFTSLPLLFISGISWPGVAVPAFWKYISWLIPSTLGINAFVRINTMGALLEDVSFEDIGLWIQTGVYFLTACAAYYYMIGESRRKAEALNSSLS